MKNVKNYDIGLDIGVGSVGWCVTDENSNIIKRNGKNMWGSRIFDEASTAQERRTFRSAKRRLNRRKERINILQSLMLDDMEIEHPNFFQMLRESSFDDEDKIASTRILGEKYNLFSDDKLTDAKYYNQFPTIYHLRNYLINTKEKVDLRLVYLAIHHIIKYRGNFLHEGDFSENTNEVSNKLDIILNYLRENYGIELRTNKEQIFKTLVQKNLSKSNKKDEIISYFNYDKEYKQIIVNVINSFLGYTFDISKIFDIELDKAKISFASDIENEEEIKEALQENAEIYDCMNTIYSWYVLQDILKGRTYISEAFIDKYEKYASDLKLLKKVYKEYFPDEYKDMFRKIGNNNYVAYNGKNSGEKCKKCKPEDFFTVLKKKIDELPDECKEKEFIKSQIEDNNFLNKINVTDNGAIPHQLHQKELEIILENQSKYYKTLSDNKENIIKLFSFRIPYYVGPLANGNSKWAWVIRKNDEPIRPWNFEDVVDEDATAEEFIKRMTNKCTYILNEEVMPKQSLLYSRFCVLNELNNIRVDNKHLSKDTKRKIIDKLFKNKKKVTASMIKDLLKHDGIEVSSITGLSNGETFNSNMASYIDMEKILGKVDDTNFDQCENIIYWITIFEEKKILKRKIKKSYPELTEDQINKLAKLRYTGWSRLSKRLIVGLKSNDGETIMEKLEKTPLNFMQIINQKEYGFDKQLEELMPKTTGEIQYKDIDDIPTSPANKRAIWQSMCVVNEIVNIMKKEPHNIYIEFARDEEQKKVIKDNRAKQLLKKYEEIEKQLNYLKDYDRNVYKELKQHQSDKVLSEKMYLYYIQNGKCLYSGKALNIDELNMYEVDHIIPQSYIKDDSIDNKALVIREENQRKKDSLLLSDEIIDGRTEWWKSLLDNGLISQTKFYRLIRRKMFETDNEKGRFVQRQLVETRQITKYVTNLLVNEYKNSNVYAIRAELTHNFRTKFKIRKNRNVNNYHHAQDAYILNVIGNILYREWIGLEEFKYNDYVKKYFKNGIDPKEKYGMIMNFVNKKVNIEKVKTVMQYKDCFISRMLQEETGLFYNQTLYSPKDKPVIPLKLNKPVEKYGGYSGENKAYYVVYGYTNKKNENEYQLTGIPVQTAYKIKQGTESIENYIKNTYLKDKEYSNFKIIRNKILKNQEYLDENNEPMRFCSDTEIRPSKELIVNNTMSELIYLMNCDENQLDDNDKEKLENSYEFMFDYLMEKINKEYKCLINSMNKIIDKRADFMNLEEKDKKTVINQIIDMIESKYVNLKVLGLSTAEGRMNNKNFNTNKLLNMTFIDKSVTGMYERRFKINGLENSSSK